MESQPEIANLSHAAYEGLNEASQRAAEHRYEIVPEYTDTSKERNHTLYKNLDNNEHVLAFRGTHKRSLLRDLVNDAQLAVGLKPKEFKDAERIARDVKAKYENLTLSGHSLGGGKAIHAGKATQTRSVTHNPYVSVQMRKGLKDYFKKTDSEAHIHAHDVIGASATAHLPQSHTIAYTHHAKNAHAIKSFHGKKGVRLSDKKVKTPAIAGAKVLAVASKIANHIISKP